MHLDKATGITFPNEPLESFDHAEDYWIVDFEAFTIHCWASTYRLAMEMQLAKGLRATTEIIHK